MTPEAKIHYANLSVPRYTSYPTAPHFNASVTQDDALRWLRHIAPGEALSLYLHVPFCREICLYCGCHTKATRQDSPLHDYADGLVGEIRLVGAAIDRRQPVSHLHWGGGTPSLLPPIAFHHVMTAIDRHFDVSPEADHAIELDPRSVTADLAAMLRDARVTRVSLGVQDFAADVQVAIGRVQPFEVVAEAVDHLRRVGITAINFDLMYGLPLQTAAGLVATVAKAARLAPSRISLFGYAHVPWMKKHQRLIDATTLPGARSRLDLEAAARDALDAAGYIAIGLDHFALPADSMVQAAETNALRRNFQGYTTDDASTLVGIGASSISRLREGYAQNALDVSHWRQAIEAGLLPTVRGKAFSAQDRLRAAIIEQLMCSYTVDLDAVSAINGVSLDDRDTIFDALERPFADGLATRDGGRITMTEAGRPFVRVIAAAFDAYLPREAARHSVAV